MKPILFSTDMVRALIENRKTQTRRVMRPQPPEGVDVSVLCNNTKLDGVQFVNNAMTVGQGEDTQWFQSKYLEGDVLYVRESFQAWSGGTGEYPNDCDIYEGPLNPSYETDENRLHPSDMGLQLVYKATPDGSTGPWRPSIHMPEWAARLFLRVTNVRVERAQDMTPDSFVAEGMQMDESCFWLGSTHKVKGTPKVFSDVKLAFQDIWDSTVTDTAFNWGNNPWVWVYDFERIEKPTPA